MMEMVEGPEGPAISLEDARKLSAQLADVGDEALTLELEAATAALDGPRGWLRRCIISQVWRIVPYRTDGDSKARVWDIGSNMQIVAAKAGDEPVEGATILRDNQGPYVSTGATLTSVDIRAGFGEAKDVPVNIGRAVVLLAEANVLRSGADGNMRSFSVEGAFSEGYNSPDVALRSTMAAVEGLLRPYKRLVFA